MNMLRCMFTVVFLGISSSNADTLSYLRFEEGSGYGAYDETGLMNGEVLGFTSVDPGGGDIGGTGWSTSVPSSTVSQTGEANTGSLHFGPGMVDLSNANALSLGYEFTIELFMKPDMPITSSPILYLSPFSSMGFALTESLGTLYFNSGFQGYNPSPASADDVQIGVWQHLALVKESEQYSIYLNGNLLATDSLPTYTDGPYWFSGDPTTGNRTLGDGFRGWIDEFRISDEALSPSQFLNASIPEPGTLGLLFLGTAGLIWRKRRI